MSLDAYRSEVAQHFTEAVAADDALVKECKRVRDLPQATYPRIFVIPPKA